MDFLSLEPEVQNGLAFTTTRRAMYCSVTLPVCVDLNSCVDWHVSLTHVAAGVFRSCKYYGLQKIWADLLLATCFFHRSPEHPLQPLSLTY